MLERGLTRLIKESTRRSANGEWHWAAIGAVAYLMRRSLRYEEPSETVRVRPGEEVTIAVRERES